MNIKSGALKRLIREELVRARKILREGDVWPDAISGDTDPADFVRGNPDMMRNAEQEQWGDEAAYLRDYSSDAERYGGGTRGLAQQSLSDEDDFDAWESDESFEDIAADADADDRLADIERTDYATASGVSSGTPDTLFPDLGESTKIRAGKLQRIVNEEIKAARVNEAHEYYSQGFADDGSLCPSCGEDADRAPNMIECECQGDSGCPECQGVGEYECDTCTQDPNNPYVHEDDRLYACQTCGDTREPEFDPATGEWASCPGCGTV